MKVFNCRLCNGKLSEPKINLGSTPLANEFLKGLEPQDLFPLEVCVCESCDHYQLNEQIDPERLFRNYLYVAGTSPVNVEHFKQYAIHMVEMFNLKPASKVLDIASNDGVLLQHFKDLGMFVLGIDPALNLAVAANKHGIPTIAEFFTEELADKIILEEGKFDLITANNVFAHVPDMIGFAKGVKKLLKPDGVFSFEVSYFFDVCNNTLFDTVYHEHTSYHTVTPLIKFFKSHGMKVFDVERLPNHGGSIRVFVRLDNSILKTVKENFNYNALWINALIAAEKNINVRVEKLQTKIHRLGYDLRIKLQEIKKANKSIAIYGMPAKATTLLYALSINEEIIDFAVDDAPLKQHTYSPGKHIPVFPVQAIYDNKPDVLLVLAWNFANSIIEKNKAFKGAWLIPLPTLKEVINV